MSKLKVVEVPIDQIKPYERNPRKNDATVEKLVNIIPKVGFNQPLLLDKNNVIVKGHARYEACKRLGFTSIPCVYTENGDELVKLDRIADNKVHELTKWDLEGRAREIDMLGIDFDMSELGVKPKEDYDFVGDGFDDGEAEEVRPADDEERRRRYQELLEKLEREQVSTPVITTQADINKAKESQGKVAKEKEYQAIKCECCGKVLYVEKGKWFEV